jgi:hypothetical protein
MTGGKDSPLLGVGNSFPLWKERGQFEVEKNFSTLYPNFESRPPLDHITDLSMYG